MKSRTYSRNSTLSHTLRTTWQAYGKGTLLLFLAFFVAIAGTALWRCLPWMPFMHGEEPTYAYVMMDGLVAYVLPVLLPMVGVAVALSLFSFLFSKRKAMHTTLVGGNRTQLFCIRYLFGALSLTAMLFVSLLVSFLISGFTFGFYALTARNYVYMFLTLTEMLLLPYAVASLFASLSGRLSEAVVSASLVLLLPEGLALLIRNFASNFLFGALAGGDFSAETAFTVQGSVSFIKPFGYTSLLPQFYACYNNKISAETVAEVYPLAYAKVIQYAIIIAFLTVVARLLFKKRPMELVEKTNARPSLSFAVAGVTAAVLSSFLAWIPSRILAVLMILLAFLVLFFFVLSFYRKGVGSFRGYVKVALPASGALLVVVCTFLCGFFGFSSRVPTWTEIGSVSISYVGMPYHLTEYSGGYGSFSIYPRVQGVLTEVTTAPRDICKIIEMHKLLIEDGYQGNTGILAENASDTVVGAEITLYYKLKDGTEMIRTYPSLKLSTLASLLCLDEMVDYRAAILEAYTPRDELPIPENGWTNVGIPVNSENHFYVSGNAGDTMQRVTLSDTDMRALLAAIRKDKKKETAAQRYFPEEDCLGILYFCDPDRFLGALESPFVTRAYIYARDTNTITFLREKGLYDAFTKGYTVTECTVYEMPIVMNEERFNPVYSRVFQLTNTLVPPKEITDNPISLSDEALTEAIDNARAVYFVKDHGYLLRLRITDGTGNIYTVYKFSPKE